MNLIDKIGRELQQRMGYSDIDAYLGGFGIDVRKPTSGVNSKWVYTKERLSDASTEKVAEIAKDLDLAVPNQRTTLAHSSKFWRPNHFRLFVSHISAHKVACSALARALLDLNISGFVAHVDIEPTKEWQNEIENALFSMDALAAVLMLGFEQSKWCDQEVGVAIGREVLIIPIRKGLDPYGFIGKYQGLQANGKTVKQIAQELFEIISTNPATRTRYAEAIVSHLLSAADPKDSLRLVNIIESIDGFPASSLERLRENLPENSIIVSEREIFEGVQRILQKNGLEPLRLTQAPSATNDDIPF